MLCVGECCVCEWVGSAVDEVRGQVRMQLVTSSTMTSLFHCAVFGV